MRIPIYQVDAFAEQVFQGNPAAVCPLQEWLPDPVLQAIAEENHLSETAFYVPEGEGFRLRWFTPNREVTLCGHATLATAHVLFEKKCYLGNCILFHSLSGPLTVLRQDKTLTLDFPKIDSEITQPEPLLSQALGAQAVEVRQGMDLMAVFDDEEKVVSLKPDFSLLSRLDTRGVIVTAPGRKVDFVSRFFAPKCGINEDPVTGSAHCALTPYWAQRLGKTVMNARQVSPRGGNLKCELQGYRVLISGTAVLFMEGMLEI